MCGHPTGVPLTLSRVVATMHFQRCSPRASRRVTQSTSMCTGEATNTPLRLGVIGAGFISQVTHLHAAAASPQIRLAGLADGRTALLGAVAGRFGAERTYDHHSELL